MTCDQYRLLAKGATALLGNELRTTLFMYMLTPNRTERNWFRLVARTSGVEVRGSEGRHPDKTRGPQERGGRATSQYVAEEIGLAQEL